MMQPDEVKVGMCVEYAPSPNFWYRGKVAAEPWQLGGGTWVTKLTDMEPGYAALTGKRGDKATTVHAAALRCMRIPSDIDPREAILRSSDLMQRYRNEVPFHATTHWLLAVMRDGKMDADDLRDCLDLAEAFFNEPE